MSPLEDRFWSKVNKTEGCWLWTASTVRNGYGRITAAGRTLLAHRVSWELHFGEIPKGRLVCHRCDNPSCVNPAHLFIGTHLDNIADRDRKGRQARGDRHRARLYPESVPRLHGERNGMAKLNAEMVVRIRAWYATGDWSLREIAALVGVSCSQISNIVRSESWAHTAEQQRGDEASRAVR